MHMDPRPPNACFSLQVIFQSPMGVLGLLYTPYHRCGMSYSRHLSQPLLKNTGNHRQLRWIPHLLRLAQGKVFYLAPLPILILKFYRLQGRQW